MIKFVKLVKIEEVIKISKSEVYLQDPLGNCCISLSTQVNTENIINQESVVFNTKLIQKKSIKIVKSTKIMKIFNNKVYW